MKRKARQDENGANIRFGNEYQTANVFLDKRSRFASFAWSGGWCQGIKEARKMLECLKAVVDEFDRRAIRRLRAAVGDVEGKGE